jgi:hypothetical protein
MEVSCQLEASATLTPERDSSIHRIESWVGLSVDLDAAGKREILHYRE